MAVGFILAFAQIILLAKISASALRKVENFAVELEHTVDERTQELVNAQDQLIRVARQTETENVRRRISQDIHDDISGSSDDLENMLANMRNHITRFFEDSTYNVTIIFPEHPDKVELNPELKRNPITPSP
jgi:hypothetical protein